MEETHVSTEKLLRSYLQTFQNNLKENIFKNDAIMQYFVPSGTKNSKRAKISLQVLVSHFSTSYQPQDDLDSKQQTYLLTTIQMFIVSLLKSYTILDFFDVILKNEEVDLRVRYSEWKEFIRLICSIPERSANLMALDKSSGCKEENSFLNEAKLFDKFAVDSEFLIYSKSGKGDLEEDEIKILVFACSELFSKICRIGHSKILAQIVYSKLLNRLHDSTSHIYYKIWRNIISSFSSHTIELFLTAFLLHSQNQDLSKITNPVSIEDKSRYLIRKVSTLLSLLIEKNNNENISYLIKFKYFVGGKIFPISIIRVLCCFLSWGEFQDQFDDMLRKLVGRIDNLKLNVNDDLVQLLKTLISSWSDPTFIKHASNSTQIYVTSAILIVFGYLPKSTLIKAAISREITPGITRWLQSTSEESRKLGMVTAEMLSKLIDVSENVLDFGLNPEDEDVKYLRQLIELKDGIVDLPDIDYEDKVEADLNVESILEKTSYHENTINNEHEFVTYQNEIKSGILAEIKNSNKARIADSDDEDDFEPYPMKEESDEEDDIVESIPQTKKKKILTPVYIIDLLSYLKASNDPDKLEVAMKAAEKLIREKTNFGTELDEHAVELARLLIGLQDNFELKGFEEYRHAAMVALICGCPKIAVPYIIQQFFEKKYSLAEKYLILSALSTGARELAGLQNIEDKKKNYITDTLSQKISELNITPIKTLKGTSSDKVRRFSRKPLVESMRTISVNRFSEVAAKTFFFPLTAGFWNLARDRDRSSFMNDPTLVQRYVTTLGVFVQCSVNIISLSQITREFWDLMFSLRFFDDPAVLCSILFGISVILNTLSERELAESFGKELIETQQWVTTIFENKVNEQVQSIAAWVLVKIKEIIKEYQILLMGNLLPLT
ncbi:telomere length regulation protein [Glomus cerebriforme]|uniref:Telomere length regulation protein n=1 Tax=Glomus cerebriforme TaxID=658196 RepID=A0A397TS71_9GLOM|nr:telomere length regulation protein [Glomus cerebriforme]